MYDAAKVIIGLIIFVGAVTFPIWHDEVLGGGGDAPEAVISATARAAGQCVHERDFMKASHMDVVNEWRDRVVRAGERVYEGDDGRRYVMGITGTCLGCHDNKTEFCDRCHDYLGVKPYCWECHVVTEGGQR